MVAAVEARSLGSILRHSPPFSEPASQPRLRESFLSSRQGTMFRQAVRKFATTTYKAAALATKVDAGNQYGVHLATAQQHVNGFVGGS